MGICISESSEGELVTRQDYWNTLHCFLQEGNNIFSWCQLHRLNTAIVCCSLEMHLFCHHELWILTWIPFYPFLIWGGCLGQGFGALGWFILFVSASFLLLHFPLDAVCWNSAMQYWHTVKTPALKRDRPGAILVSTGGCSLVPSSVQSHPWSYLFPW